MSSSDGSGFRFDTDTLHLAALQAQVLARCKGVLNHDLRNAMQGIHAGIELIARTTNPAIAAKVSVAECIAMLKEQLANLQTTLERMIADTTLGAEKPARIDVADLLRNALRLLRHEPGISTAKVDAPAHAYALARVGLVRTVLLALLFDAADTVAKSGSIAIRITVTDHIDLMIEVYAAPTHATNAQLVTIANSILRSEDATVAAAAEGAHRGVRIRLQPAEPVENVVDPSGKLRVLIADAHRDAADTLAMLLQIEGCEARVAYDAASAIRAAHDFRPNLVLLDEGLRDLKTEQLHRASPGSGLKIIEMSQASRALHQGVDAEVRKPIEFGALKGVLSIARQD
jgi:CheY-like chemotaxis protein